LEGVNIGRDTDMEYIKIFIQENPITLKKIWFSSEFETFILS